CASNERSPMASLRRSSVIHCCLLVGGLGLGCAPTDMQPTNDAGEQDGGLDATADATIDVFSDSAPDASDAQNDAQNDVQDDQVDATPTSGCPTNTCPAGYKFNTYGECVVVTDPYWGCSSWSATNCPALPNAISTCDSLGACAIGTCRPGYADCNAIAS